jgi:hypothetical protein
MKRKDRPNTVYGLHAKRADLLTFLKRLDAERRSVLRSLAYVDAAIGLFVSPELDLARYDAPDMGSQAEFRGFIADLLREAGKPVAINAVTAAWMAHYGIEATDLNRNRARCRVRAYFEKLAEHGIVERVGKQGPATVWELVNEFPHD